MALVDNRILRDAIAAFAAKPEQSSYLEVVRNCLQGDLLLDMTGHAPQLTDGASTFPAGSTIGFRETTGPDGARGLLAFTRQEEVARMHDDPTTKVQTLGQPAVGVLEFAKQQGYAWLYLDPAGPTCGVSMRDADFTLTAPHNDAVKAAIATGDRSAVLDALARGGKLLYAVNPVPSGGAQVRTSTAPDGDEVRMAFTSAAEAVVRTPATTFAAVEIAQVVDEALEAPYSGLLLNPAGPWIVLRHDELRALRGRLAP